MPFLDDPVTAVSALPVILLPLFVLLSAALEYVVPPYWGDLFVLVGFFLAVGGAAPPAAIFLAALAGSTAGAAIAYRLGRRYGWRIVRRVTLRRRGRYGERMQALLARFGERVILANRFVPVVRGFLLYGAGSLRMDFRTVMGYTAVSNLAWLGLLMAAAVLGGEWQPIEASFRRYSLATAGVIVALLAAWGIWAWWRLGRRPEQVVGEEAEPTI